MLTTRQSDINDRSRPGPFQGHAFQPSLFPGRTKKRRTLRGAFQVGVVLNVDFATTAWVQARALVGRAAWPTGLGSEPEERLRGPWVCRKALAGPDWHPVW